MRLDMAAGMKLHRLHESGKNLMLIPWRNGATFKSFNQEIA